MRDERWDMGAGSCGASLKAGGGWVERMCVCDDRHSSLLPHPSRQHIIVSAFDRNFNHIDFCVCVCVCVCVHVCVCVCVLMHFCDDRCRARCPRLHFWKHTLC
eukprot:1361360-Rhodomonas_salina.2